VLKAGEDKNSVTKQKRYEINTGEQKKNLTRLSLLSQEILQLLNPRGISRA
jgi:hypothetical protein